MIYYKCKKDSYKVNITGDSTILVSSVYYGLKKPARKNVGKSEMQKAGGTTN
ncbi:hypothetical protein [Aquibacillus halophilus]|uniref:hypothetical protein n=1 Tax=Aquibacillus halophilus TaxID=930132 RepID=UPI00129AB658|nr:hypothetical protein [Aquibacillus halophilus]